MYGSCTCTLYSNIHCYLDRSHFTGKNNYTRKNKYTTVSVIQLLIILPIHHPEGVTVLGFRWKPQQTQKLRNHVLYNQVKHYRFTNKMYGCFQSNLLLWCLHCMVRLEHATSCAQCARGTCSSLQAAFIWIMWSHNELNVILLYVMLTEYHGQIWIFGCISLLLSPRPPFCFKEPTHYAEKNVWKTAHYIARLTSYSQLFCVQHWNTGNRTRGQLWLQCKYNVHA